MIQCALRNFLIIIYLDFQIIVLLVVFIYLFTYLVGVYLCVYVCAHMCACTSDTGSIQKGASDSLEQKL